MEDSLLTLFYLLSFLSIPKTMLYYISCHNRLFLYSWHNCLTLLCKTSIIMCYFSLGYNIWECHRACYTYIAWWSFYPYQLGWHISLMTGYVRHSSKSMTKNNPHVKEAIAKTCIHILHRVTTNLKLSVSVWPQPSIYLANSNQTS